jgi:hypothetical protein
MILILLFVASYLNSENRFNSDEYNSYENELFASNRIFSQPKIFIEHDENIHLRWNQNMSDVIYYSLYIYKNLPGDFTDQSLFSNIVEGLCKYPNDNYKGVYYRILVAECLGINMLIEFISQDKNQTKVNIYKDEECISFTFKNSIDEKEILNNKLELITTTANVKPIIQKDDIVFIWYVFWSKMFEVDVSKLINISNIKKDSYNSITSMFSSYNRKDFCLLGQRKVTNILIRYYNLKYSQIDFVEYLALSELINRAYIAPM